MKLSEYVTRNGKRKRRRMRKEENTGDQYSKEEECNTKRTMTEKDTFEGSKGHEEDQEDANNDLLNHGYGLLNFNTENLEYNMDEEDLELQAVLLSSMTTKTSSFCEESNVLKARKEDVKMKGIAKSCSMKESFGFSRFSNNYRGESSCTFCAICDDAKSPGLMEYHDKCGHSFCKDCIKNYVQESVQESIHRIYCPQTNCERVLSYKFCSSFLSEEMKILWDNTLSEMKALEQETIIQCPNEDCLACFYDDKRRCPIRACPECCRHMCYSCRMPYKDHFGLSCEEFKEQIRLRDQLNFITKIEDLLKASDFKEQLGRNLRKFMFKNSRRKLC